jgi:hypothetical protein
MEKWITTNLHFDNEFYSIIVFFFCAILLIKTLHSSHISGKTDWSDLLTQNGPDNKVSLTKVMQLVGLFISSWVIVHLTIFGKLSWDIFTAYLAYVGGSEGFSKYMKVKHATIQATQKTRIPRAPKTVK